MRSATSLPLLLALPLLFAACGERQGEEAQLMEFARPEVTAGLVMSLPVTTSSDDARNHFLQGMRAMDMGRFVAAHAHFLRAVEADTAFAHAYLNAANTAPSLDAFRSNLARAAAHEASATETERLLIEITQAGFANDLERQLQLATRLVELQPNSPRAWLALASVQQGRANHTAARTSAMKAAELSPRFAPAYVFLGNSYLFNEPRDLPKAEESMQQVVEAEPEEEQSHDLLGDALRAQGKLEEARAAYTRSAELDRTSGLALQQRGHVNSFLGDYAAARADYDSAMALGKANERPEYATYRAFVSVHEGSPPAAIQELNALVDAIDGMGIPEPTGLKVNALTNLVTIALHTGDFTAAEQAMERRAALMRQQADQVGTDEYRRAREANIAYYHGMLAAHTGDYARAAELADECARLVEPDANPRKMEPVHEMRGFTSLQQGSYPEAIAHFRQGNLDDPYTKYHLALAYEGAGNTTDAKRLFGELATYNFNDVTVALVRTEAMEKR